MAARPGLQYIRSYAQVGPTTYLGQPPPPPSSSTTHPGAASSSPGTSSSKSTHPVSPVKHFDARIIAELQKAATRQSQPGSSTQPTTGTPSPAAAATPLTELVEQYMKNAGTVLNASLPYESRPSAERRATFSHDAPDSNGRVTASNADGALVMVAHAVHDRTGKHKVTYSTGFTVHAPGIGSGGAPGGESIVVTCAHTLEEIRHDPLLRAARPSPALANGQVLSGSFVVGGSPASPTFHPVTSILSAMHRGDLILLSSPSASASGPGGGLRTLPVNPYPVHPGTPIRAHFVADKPPETGPHRDGWTPWIGGTWRKWIKGTVVGYRDYAGREAKPGTYDSLAHLHFEPPPTPGSSGGPIIDEESGSVIGVVLGTQLVNQVEGVRGWGVPSEMIFEMFSLPGLRLKSQG